MIHSVDLSEGLVVAFPGSSTNCMFEVPFLVCFVTELVRSKANMPMVNILHIVLQNVHLGQSCAQREAVGSTNQPSLEKTNLQFSQRPFAQGWRY